MLENLKKFGLEHCDLESIVSNVAVFLRLLGINIDKRNKKPIPLVCYIITLVAAVCYFYVYVVSMVWFVFWRCAETGDTIGGIVVFSLGIASEIATFKLLFMYIYSDTVRDIVEGYIALDNEVTVGSRKSMNMAKYLRVVKKRAILFWCAIVSNGVAYAGQAVVLPGRHQMEDNFDFLGLEPILESPNYEIAFLINVMAIFFICYLTSNIGVFLIVMTGYSEAQLLASSEELVHLWDDANKDNNLEDCESVTINSCEVHEHINRSVNKRLIEIMKCHTKIIDMFNLIETVFNGAMAAEFCLLIVSLIAELLGGLENTYLELPFALMQVTMDCITGQRIIDANEVFTFAVYDCKWENFDVRNAKIVLLMLQNSQKTLTLSAGGITTLDYVRLMSVLNSIYSAYTTLRSTMN